ncbi:hypothetical protein PAXINDRAFT_21786 [Paxillus involutus ATCC 200175]|uniref:Uncharacterized protein n=1 Tax=Paxillus involutus ATCC 200175 TaxID=664439 RepID=A0A0C9SLS4_PAXIN|nr:hypothetical protein PAXINDRAFT_21786 [Paxillus involutus ATCC 200175]
MGPKEYELDDALEDWREQKTKDIYGESHLIDLGPGLVMPDSVLERIIACAHHLKISTVDDLRRETRWSGTDKFGSEVISVIHCIIPVPVSAPAFSTTPLQRRSVPQSAATSATISNSLAVYPDETNHGQSIATSAKKNKCGACGLEGHNKRNRICAMHPNRQAMPNDKENQHIQ